MLELSERAKMAIDRVRKNPGANWKEHLLKELAVDNPYLYQESKRIAKKLGAENDESVWISVANEAFDRWIQGAGAGKWSKRARGPWRPVIKV